MSLMHIQRWKQVFEHYFASSLFCKKMLIKSVQSLFPCCSCITQIEACLIHLVLESRLQALLNYELSSKNAVPLPVRKDVQMHILYKNSALFNNSDVIYFKMHYIPWFQHLSLAGVWSLLKFYVFFLFKANISKMLYRRFVLDKMIVLTLNRILFWAFLGFYFVSKSKLYHIKQN